MTDTFNIYLGTSPTTMVRVATGLSDPAYPLSEPLKYSTTYYWRIDSVGPGGTTTGDTWHFTTLALRPPVTHLGLNRRLMAAAAFSIWYEDI
jgi:hypothetical protein